MINPYANVDWVNDKQIITTTHDHVYDTNVSTSTKQHFLNLYNGGVRCFAISNYYPSKPMYPLSEWVEELDMDVPDDIIEVPNAEQHHLAYGGIFGNSIHINSLGSLFESGHERGVSPSGYSGTIENLIKDVASQLLYADGGGLTLNHPTWTYNRNLFSMDILPQILDMDERVLGIEMFSSTLWDISLWDQILSSGRRCWGFAVPDHRHKSNAEWFGRNVLVVPELTKHECLKAFRNGNMYVKYANTDLKFTEVALFGTTFTVKTNEESTIRFVADGVTVSEITEVTTSSYDIGNAVTYVRAEAETSGDRIFTQPIMISTQARKNKQGRHYWIQG